MARKDTVKSTVGNILKNRIKSRHKRVLFFIKGNFGLNVFIYLFLTQLSHTTLNLIESFYV